MSRLNEENNSKPYIIRVASQKGGVGKTTIAVNMASCIQDLGYNVLLVDCDTTNPSVGLHLGLESAAIGYKQLIKGKSKLSEALIIHPPTGIKAIVGSINTKPFITTEYESRRFIDSLRKTDFDFIILDTQPGYYVAEEVGFVDETLLITTPDMPSCTSIMRSVAVLEKEKLKNSLLINRVKNKNYEINKREIEEMYPGRIVGSVPESEIVPISIAERIPAYILQRRSNFSNSIYYSLGVYVSRRDTYPDGSKKFKRQSFFSRLFRRKYSY
ncbi:MAG: AAA family ATPase [Candidatus Micrarchaeia archaeon]